MIVPIMDAPPVQYAATSDGYNIAYSRSGRGVPLVFVPGQFSHLEAFWHTGGMQGVWARSLAVHFHQIRFDGRGQGMSTRGIREEQTIESLGRDLEAVAGRLDVENFVLLARWYGCHIAIRYVLDHPERISALILIGCAEDNHAWPSSVYSVLPEQNWPVFLMSQIQRDVTPAEFEETLTRIDNSTTREDLAIRARAMAASTVGDALPKLRVPTLVLHPNRYVLLPESESMNVAAKIPGARFAFIDGEMLPGDAVSGIRTIEEFLSGIPDLSRSGETQELVAGALTPRETEVLRLIAAGRSNQQIADELVLSLRTVERHITNLYAKIGAHGKADATAYALRHGLTK